MILAPKNVDTTHTIAHVSLCAGYGGIDLGLKRAIPNLRTIAFSEIEAFACANLVSKMEEGLLDAAPIWTDLKTFPWAEFRDRVDILSGGYPCQPFSAAGKRQGADDPRHLWPFISAGIALMRPRCCFFENVEGHISLGLPDVIEDLAGMGYRTTWGIFSASEVGAPHQRKRVFILAHRIGAGLEGLCGHEPDRDEPGRQRAHQGGSACAGSIQAWPSRPGEQQFGWEPPRVVNSNALAARGVNDQLGGEESKEHCSSQQRQRHGDTAGYAGEAMGNTPKRQSGDPEAGDRRQGVGGTSEPMADNLRGRLPHATDQQWHSGADNHAVIGACVAESCGWQTQPSLGRDTDGPSSGMGYAELCVSCDNRTDELRLLGNGVVPATAERAFRCLSEELFNEPAAI
jgi:DNA (cytosine-5)-methyltransferase 1